jgi:hypothetical protein
MKTFKRILFGLFVICSLSVTLMETAHASDSWFSDNSGCWLESKGSQVHSGGNLGHNETYCCINDGWGFDWTNCETVFVIDLRLQ